MSVCVGALAIMFDSLSERLGGIFDTLTGRGVLSQKDVEVAMREIRVALLEADVALPVAKEFVEKIKKEAVGESVIRSIKPGQQIIKIVHDNLVEMLGGKETDSNLRVDSPPAVIMLAGLQGSGKTTTAGKLAKHLSEKHNKKVLLASLDVRRPAAMEQLAILAEQCNQDVSSLPIVKGQPPSKIANRATQIAKVRGSDVVILDTAGRTTIDNELMAEVAEIAAISKPSETILVADALTGQDAVETAQRFHDRLPLTGLVLTRLDGDSRGGAALSMRAVTGLPIKFVGTGEKLEGLEAFDPKRVAGRILQQGDIVSLVEKAAERVDAAKAERINEQLSKGRFDLDDYAEQMKNIRGMGGLGTLIGMLPGAKKISKSLAGAQMSDTALARDEAVINSMTIQERRKPAILNASRRKRIAAGAGVEVADVNRMLKKYQQMSQMIKTMSKGGRSNPLGMLGQLGVSPDNLDALGKLSASRVPDVKKMAVPNYIFRGKK